jgi:hypothetical protein
MAFVPDLSQQRLILSGVSWEEYTRMLRVFAERPSLRLTYDRGALELRTLFLEHESLVRFFSLLILALTLEFGSASQGWRLDHVSAARPQAWPGTRRVLLDRQRAPGSRQGAYRFATRSAA